MGGKYFMTDVFTPEQRRKNMQHIRSQNTKIEVILRKALWKKGYRYRKNYKKLLFMGWTVIRFWGTDIKKNADECVRVVEETIFELKMSEEIS